MNEVVFVTGGNGFIGRHVVSALIECGLQPRVLLSKPDAEFSQRFGNVETLIGDLLDEPILERGLDGASALLHLASKSVDRDGSGFERTNIDGAKRVAALASAAGIQRAIYLSTVGVYGHGSHRLADETTPLNPDTPFSRSKAEAEQVFLQHHRQGDFEAAILRHRFVYGEGDQAVLPRLIGAAKKYPFWISGGRAQLSLVWAADLARSVSRLATGEGQLDPDYPIYHVTDGQPLSYRQVISTICRAFGWKTPSFSIPFALLYGPVRMRELMLGIDPEISAASVTSIRLKLVAQDNSFSSKKLAALLPDQQFMPFDEALAACLDYYRQFAGGQS